MSGLDEVRRRRGAAYAPGAAANVPAFPSPFTRIPTFTSNTSHQRTHGGGDEDENLALACHLAAGYRARGAICPGSVPGDRKTPPGCFIPRRDNRDDHFRQDQLGRVTWHNADWTNNGSRPRDESTASGRDPKTISAAGLFEAPGTELAAHADFQDDTEAAN